MEMLSDMGSIPITFTILKKTGFCFCISLFFYYKKVMGIEPERAEGSCEAFRSEHASGAHRTANRPAIRAIPITFTILKKQALASA